MPAGGCTTIAWQVAVAFGIERLLHARAGPSWRARGEHRARAAPLEGEREAGVPARRAEARRPGAWRPSYREHRRARRRVHVAPSPRADDLAALHHEVLVGERSARNRSTAPPAGSPCSPRGGERADGALDVLDDRRLDAFGGLVEDQQLRAACASARPMASCCCWPPDRSPPRRRIICLQHREHARRCASGMRRRRPAACARPIAQVFLHGEAREDLAPLRHVADAGARALRTAAARVMSVPSKRDRCRSATGTQAHQARAAAWSCRRRCGPSSTVTLPVGAVEAHVAQDVAAAVVLVEVPRRRSA